jgi:FkbM family methyltransferase
MTGPSEISRFLKRTATALLGARVSARIRAALGRSSNEFEPKVTTVDIAGRRTQFYSATLLAEKRAREILTKEPETIIWLDQLQPADVLWDIGANIGIYSVYAAMARGCRVIAFEPVAGNYYLLNRNIELNELDSLVTGYCLAMADRSGFDTLYIPKTTLAASAASYGQQTLTNKLRHRQGCIGSTIDDLVNVMPFPSYMKIDVDGLEPLIIAGASAVLSDRRLRSLLIELNAENRAPTIARLKDFGLEPQDGDGSFPVGKKVRNFIFVRNAE